MNLEQESKTIVKTSIVIMVWNAFLAVIKLFAAIFGKSGAMLSDAINSLSDILTNIVVMISGKWSKKGIDKDHPYGHEKFDSMVSVLLGVAIIITAFEIAKAAATTLYEYLFQNGTIETPHYLALVVAIATIMVKEVLYHYTKRNAKKARSQALAAQAMDHRGDEIASFGAFIGIGGTIFFQWSFLEPAASIFISLFVARLGFKIVKEGIAQVVDQAAPDEIQTEIRAIVAKHPEVCRIDELKTRMFGMKLYVDLEIRLKGTMTLRESHAIAEKVHDDIENTLPDVLHCMIHVNPECDPSKTKTGNV
ncbi:MAG: cation diffusion facilitator family transporter [Candidatus Izemoplasmatales bacterium]|nr:cation diffusion facilitator family transporter [Candidatus Izemoplasmatales bacterium]